MSFLTRWMGPDKDVADQDVAHQVDTVEPIAELGENSDVAPVEKPVEAPVEEVAHPKRKAVKRRAVGKKKKR